MGREHGGRVYARDGVILRMSFGGVEEDWTDDELRDGVDSLFFDATIRRTVEELAQLDVVVKEPEPKEIDSLDSRFEEGCDSVYDDIETLSTLLARALSGERQKDRRRDSMKL